MKRTILRIITALLIVGLAGCGKTADKTVNLVLSEVRTAMIDAQGTEEAYLLDTDALLNLYGIREEDVAQSASYVTMSGTFPDEIILVEAVDEAAAERIAASLETRLNEVMIQSETYDPDNYKAAQACKVETNGLYISLILSPNQASLTEIYQSYFS